MHAVTVEGISSPHCQFEPSSGAILPVVDILDWQKHSVKADQLTLASGGSEHA